MQGEKSTDLELIVRLTPGFEPRMKVQNGSEKSKGDPGSWPGEPAPIQCLTIYTSYFDFLQRKNASHFSNHVLQLVQYVLLTLSQAASTQCAPFPRLSSPSRCIPSLHA